MINSEWKMNIKTIRIYHDAIRKNTNSIFQQLIYIGTLFCNVNDGCIAVSN